MAGNEPLVWTSITDEVASSPPAPAPPPAEDQFTFDLGRALAALDHPTADHPTTPTTAPTSVPLPGTASPVFTSPPAEPTPVVRWPEGTVTPVPAVAPPATVAAPTVPPVAPGANDDRLAGAPLAAPPTPGLAAPASGVAVPRFDAAGAVPVLGVGDPAAGVGHASDPGVVSSGVVTSGVVEPGSAVGSVPGSAAGVGESAAGVGSVPGPGVAASGATPPRLDAAGVAPVVAAGGASVVGVVGPGSGIGSVPGPGVAVSGATPPRFDAAGVAPVAAVPSADAGFAGSLPAGATQAPAPAPAPAVVAPVLEAGPAAGARGGQSWSGAGPTSVAPVFPGVAGPAAHPGPAATSPAPTVERVDREVVEAPELPRRGAPETSAIGPLPQRAAMPQAPAPALPDTHPERTTSATTPVAHERRSGGEPAPTDAAAPAVPFVPVLPNIVLPAAAPPTTQGSATAERVANPSEIRQFRQAQRRAAKHARKGRVFGRMMLFLALFGGSIGFALTLGRTYMFPTQWDAPLEAPVNRLESARGPGFARVVPLVDEPTGDYAATLADVMLAGEVAAHLPVWRALGLAAGTAADADLAAAVAAAFPALYDPTDDRIVRRDGATDTDLAGAVADAFATHLTLPDGGTTAPPADPGAPVAPLGLVPLVDLVGALVVLPEDDAAAADPGVDGPAVFVAEGHAQTNSPGAALAEALEVLPDSDGVITLGNEPDPTPAAVAGGTADPVADLTGLPLPMRYQLVAPARLAVALPGATDVADLLDDALGAAPAPVLDSTDTAVGAPLSLGADDWTLVWATRLDRPAVDRLVAGVVSESVQPFTRGTTVCVAATFGSADELSAATVLADLNAWAAAGPAAARAAVTAVDATTTQLVTCDPGRAAVAPAPAAVDALVRRQLERLG